MNKKSSENVKLVPSVQRFMDSSDQKRVEMVEKAIDPRALLAEIPATEIWFTIKRLNPNDALPLIKYATPEQLQVICDIEWWKKDRLNADSIYEWLEYMMACGMEKVMEWFEAGDDEDMFWFFKENIVVRKRDDKEEDPRGDYEWPREDAATTHEGIYYFQVLDEAKDGLIRHLLEILVKHNMELYATVMEACLWDMPSQREEEAYEVRTRRLAENGFPSFDEAIAVYAPLKKEKVKMAPKRGKLFKPTAVAPRYPLVAMCDKVLFINRVLKETEEVLCDDFLLETATLANKVLIADGEEINEEDMTASLRKALGLINIGLEVLSEGDVPKAVSLLGEYFVTTIFQVGLSEVMEVSKRAQKFFKESWLGGKEEKLEELPERERNIVRALLWKRPEYYTGGYEELPESFRGFFSIAELEEARKVLLDCADLSLRGT